MTFSVTGANSTSPQCFNEANNATVTPMDFPSISVFESNTCKKQQDKPSNNNENSDVPPQNNLVSVQHNYTDHWRDPIYDADDCSFSPLIYSDKSSSNTSEPQRIIDVVKPRRGPRGGVIEPFPVKLHEMLNQAENTVISEVVAWQPHGRCFVIHQPKRFVDEVMPKYFKQSKFTSFQRQVNLYGFRRLTRGRDRGGYYHELFLRGRSDLCKAMIRTRIKGTGTKPAASPATEPNFYEMQTCVANSHVNNSNNNSNSNTNNNNKTISEVKPVNVNIPIVLKMNTDTTKSSVQDIESLQGKESTHHLGNQAPQNLAHQDNKSSKSCNMNVGCFNSSLPTMTLLSMASTIVPEIIAPAVAPFSAPPVICSSADVLPPMNVTSYVADKSGNNNSSSLGSSAFELQHTLEQPSINHDPWHELVLPDVPTPTPLPQNTLASLSTSLTWSHSLPARPSTPTLSSASSPYSPTSSTSLESSIVEEGDNLHSSLADGTQRDALYELLDSIMMDDEIDHIIADVGNSHTPPVWSL